MRAHHRLVSVQPRVLSMSLKIAASFEISEVNIHNNKKTEHNFALHSERCDFSFLYNTHRFDIVNRESRRLVSKLNYNNIFCIFAADKHIYGYPFLTLFTHSKPTSHIYFFHILRATSSSNRKKNLFYQQ